MTQLVKILIPLELNGYLGKILHSYSFEYCPVTGMLNGDEGLLSINLAGRGILVKMLITLEPHGIF